MFHYICGNVAHIEPMLAVVDVHGIGFAVHTSLHTLSGLTVGQTATLRIHTHIREDAFELFGFVTSEELGCFRMLLGISGVGPKAALNILSAVSPDRLALAIITGDEKALTAASGVGKKLASRIILELKDKVAKEQTTAVSANLPTFDAPASSGKLGEAQAALAVLGYAPTEAASALRNIDIDNLSIEDILRQALKNLARL